jgi:hypothetical protein
MVCYVSADLIIELTPNTPLLQGVQKQGGFAMIIRVVTYHAIQGKDVEKWMETSASELRGVRGVRRVEFFRNHSDPSEYGAIMLFRNTADLDHYQRISIYFLLLQLHRQFSV